MEQLLEHFPADIDVVSEKNDSPPILQYFRFKAGENGGPSDLDE